MVVDKVTYLTLSDIHLGHNLNKTNEIINNLHNYFKLNYELIKNLDIIFLAGDVFDKLLVNNSDEYHLAIRWLLELVNICKARNIKLRILEGTPSHDWKQSKLVYTIIDNFKIDIDFKYVDTLYIEIIEKYGITILYIPDEYKHTASETYDDVLNLMKENNLSKVDICIMHGQFNYQLPMVKLACTHTEELYLNIVKYFISVGHIHSASVYQRIVAQGSFDRLAHNEEEDKGAMLFTIYKDGKCEYQFIKNKDAKTFITYDMRDMDTKDITKYLDKEIKKLRPKSYVRLIATKEQHIKRNVEDFKNKYMDIYIKIEEKTIDNTKVTSIINNDKPVLESLQINKSNIKELLAKELVKHNLTVNDLLIINKELDMCIDKVS